MKFTGEWYFPLTPDKKLILMPRFGFAFMGAYNKSKGITPFDRFSLGGSGLSGVNQLGGREIIALRGYEDNSISSSSGSATYCFSMPWSGCWHSISATGPPSA